MPFSFGIHATGNTGAWSGFGARRLKVEFPPPYGLDERETLSLDDRWLEGAELVIVRATQARAFDRRLEIAGFPLKLDTALADEGVR